MGEAGDLGADLRTGGIEVIGPGEQGDIAAGRQIFHAGHTGGIGARTPAKSADKKPAPNSQLYGFGFVRKGDIQEDGSRGPDIWDWTYPVIIPYFDHKGELIHLRPAQGGVAGPGQQAVHREKKKRATADKRG